MLPRMLMLEVKKRCLSRVWKCPLTHPPPSRDACGEGRPSPLTPDPIVTAASARGPKGAPVEARGCSSERLRGNPPPPNRWLPTTALCECSQFRGVAGAAPFLASPGMSGFVGFGGQKSWKGQAAAGRSSPPLSLQAPSQAPRLGSRRREGGKAEAARHAGARPGQSRATAAAHRLVKASHGGDAHSRGAENRRRLRLGGVTVAQRPVCPGGGISGQDFSSRGHLVLSSSCWSYFLLTIPSPPGKRATNQQFLNLFWPTLSPNVDNSIHSGSRLTLDGNDGEPMIMAPARTATSDASLPGRVSYSADLWTQTRSLGVTPEAEFKNVKMCPFPGR